MKRELSPVPVELESYLVFWRLKLGKLLLLGHVEELESYIVFCRLKLGKLLLLGHVEELENYVVFCRLKMGKLLFLGHVEELESYIVFWRLKLGKSLLYYPTRSLAKNVQAVVIVFGVVGLRRVDNDQTRSPERALRT